ncbi:MAG: hypothetical protein ACI4AA_06030 [Lachnospiraceae bacterium]
MSAKKVVGAVFSTVFRLIITVCVLYAIYELAIGAYNFGYRVFADIPAALAPGTDKEVVITETMDSKEIARSFEEAGLVEDWKLFWTQIQFSEYKDEIRPGYYTLNNSMKAEEMLEIISANPDEEKEE